MDNINESNMNRMVKSSCWAVGSFSLCFLCVLISFCGCKDGYQTPDLQTYHLRGHVKSVVVNAYNLGEEDDKYCMEHIEFDDNGRRVIDSDFTIKRNSEGFIMLIDDGMEGEGYEYDANGRVTTQKYWDTSTQIERTIKFNGDDNPLESEIYGEPDFENNGNDKPYGKNKYEYLKTDSHGNWTLRSVERIETSYIPYGEDREWMEERVIEYY